jgi:hypothetical protein
VRRSVPSSRAQARAFGTIAASGGMTASDRADASVRLAFCWSHMRRGFYDFHVST